MQMTVKFGYLVAPTWSWYTMTMRLCLANIDRLLEKGKQVKWVERTRAYLKWQRIHHDCEFVDVK